MIVPPKLGDLRQEVNYQKPTTDRDDYGSPLTEIVNGTRQIIYTDYGSRMALVEYVDVDEQVAADMPQGISKIIVTHRFLSGLNYADRMWKNGYFDTDAGEYDRDFYEITGIEWDARRIWHKIHLTALKQ